MCAFDGQEPAHVLPQQFRKALIQVGADGDVTFVALVGGRELGDHLRAILQTVAMELHGARLQSAVRGDHQKAQAGLAAGRAAVGEVLSRGCQRAGRVDNPVGGIAALLHAVQSRVELRQLLGRTREIIAAAGAARRVGAVAQIHAPLASLVRYGLDLPQVLRGDAAIKHNVVVPQFGQPRDEVFQMAVQAGIDAEIVVAPVGKVQADGELVDAGGAQGQVFLLRHEGPVGDQDGVRQGGAVLDGAYDLHHVVAHQRLATGNLHHAGAQRLHVAAVAGRLEIARFIARAPVVAVFAPAGTRVRDFERDNNRPVGQPVR